MAYFLLERGVPVPCIRSCRTRQPAYALFISHFTHLCCTLFASPHFLSNQSAVFSGRRGSSAAPVYPSSPHSACSSFHMSPSLSETSLSLTASFALSLVVALAAIPRLLGCFIPTERRPCQVVICVAGVLFCVSIVGVLCSRVAGSTFIP